MGNLCNYWHNGQRLRLLPSSQRKASIVTVYFQTLQGGSPEPPFLLPHKTPTSPRTHESPASGHQRKSGGKKTPGWPGGVAVHETTQRFYALRAGLVRSHSFLIWVQLLQISLPGKGSAGRVKKPEPVFSMRYTRRLTTASMCSPGMNTFTSPRSVLPAL